MNADFNDFDYPSDEPLTPGRSIGVEPHAARLIVWCQLYDLPPDTLNKLLAAGKGPTVFTLGRRVYCRRVDWHAWLDAAAAAGGVSATHGPSVAQHAAPTAPSASPAPDGAGRQRRSRRRQRSLG